MSRLTRKFLVPGAIVMVVSMAGVLLTTESASAASTRGFTIHNESSHSLTLETVKAVPTFACSSAAVICVQTTYPMEFPEGRPAEGSVVPPGHTQRFELKYGFSLFGGVQYAADLGYKIGNTGNGVEYRIEVYSTANESSCKVSPANAGSCGAGGLNASFR